MIGVDLLLYLVDVADREAVEDVHEHDDHEEDEEDEDDLAQPVVELQVRVVHLPHEHHQGLEGGQQDAAWGRGKCLNLNLIYCICHLFWGNRLTFRKSRSCRHLPCRRSRFRGPEVKIIFF